MALLLYSWLYVRHIWKGEFKQIAEGNRIDLISLRPGQLGLLFLGLAVLSVIIIVSFLISKTGIYGQAEDFAMFWVYLIIICERGPIYIWHLFPGRHVLFFETDKVIYFGYHLQSLKLNSLRAIKGEWKMIRGDKDKWQLDQYSEVKLVSLPLMGINIPLKYLKPEDESKLKSLLGEIMIQYKPAVSPGLEFMKIETIGKK
jgi:hypothetical protein